MTNKTLKESLVEGLEISEEAADKIQSQVDAHINEQVEVQTAVKLEESKAKLEEEYAAKEDEMNKLAEEYSKDVAESLEEETDKFLNASVKHWLEENQVSVQNEKIVDAAKGLFESMKETLEDFGLKVEADASEMIAAKDEEIQKLKESVIELEEKNTSLKESVDENSRTAIVAEETDGLAETELERVVGIAEEFEFNSEDADTFRSKVKAVVETLKTAKSEDTEEISESETHVELDESEQGGKSFTPYVDRLL